MPYAYPGDYQSRYGSVMDILDQYGSQGIADIKAEAARAWSEAKAGLSNVGMAATTLMPSLRSGNLRELAGALGRYQQGLTEMRAKYATQLSGEGLAAAEREKRAAEQLGISQQQLDIQRTGQSNQMSLGQQQLANQLKLAEMQGANQLKLGQLNASNAYNIAALQGQNSMNIARMQQYSRYPSYSYGGYGGGGETISSAVNPGSFNSPTLNRYRSYYA